MAVDPNYECSRCGKPTRREMITVKRAVFLEMGERARTIRARVVDWLCPECVAADVDWNRPPYRTPYTEDPKPPTLPEREETLV
jgi:hypothetical protein